MKILLIDDNVDYLNSIKHLLEMYGHDVATATDGVSGYAVWSNNDPCDIIFVDQEMPVRNGWCFLKMIREHTPKEEWTPVYMVSGLKLSPVGSALLQKYGGQFILKEMDCADHILDAVQRVAHFKEQLQ